MAKDYNSEALIKHKEWKGKLEIAPRCSVTNRDELSVAYTPGVAAPCLEIQKDVMESYTYTGRGNTVAVITDGTAVLGLGNIGPEASMPVMEGKCVLFKTFGNVDAVPLCVKTTDVDEFCRTVYLLSGSFGAVNLEDIAAPRCFEIEKRLKEMCDIPVFHDDQHGTAVTVLAGLINALRITGKDPAKVKTVFSGAGAAGIAIAKLLIAYGFKNIVMTDRIGAIYRGAEGMSGPQAEMAEITNPDNEKGTLADVMKGADIFIGVSAPGLVSEEMVRSMADDAIVFACANPTPEIFPEDALKAGAGIVASGRSDCTNQINNVLAFPGIFRGTLDAGASDINDAMLMAAAKALAGVVTDEELSREHIIPEAFDGRVVPAIASAVADAARECGIARIR